MQSPLPALWLSTFPEEREEKTERMVSFFFFGGREKREEEGEGIASGEATHSPTAEPRRDELS